MSYEGDITNLQQMLDRIEESAKGEERVTLGTVVEAVGRRSFGPLLLLAGAVLASPLTGIPSVPTSMGILVLLIATQMLLHRQHFWLPDWLLRRSISVQKLDRVTRWLRPSARFVDRWLQPRLTLFIDGLSSYVIALACIAIAAGMPVMELVPLSAHIAGLALSAFGLALISRDGLLALLALATTGVTFGIIVYNLI